MLKEMLFTSESVSQGHPDKIADQISDAVLDAMLKDDPFARVACETYVKTGMVLVGGEVTTTTFVDIERLAREVIKDIGYNDASMGFDYNSCAVLTAIGQQSPDIAQGVNEKDDKPMGAGDQGLMFGYACTETDVYMPSPINYAHQLMRAQEKARKDSLPWLRPDGKSQVTFKYQDGKPVSIEAIVLSSQHEPQITQSQIIEGVMECIIKPSIPSKLLHAKTQYFINPTGRFVIGGPQGDCGLTGRKIIVDSYGGMARHGGGAFSGKDPSKVDRSAAYAARYVAKNLVASGVADRLEIQISYAIGISKPVSISVETFGTSKIKDERIIEIIDKHFDLTPQGIINMLDLQKPIYQKTATYGHFGRHEDVFSWEKLDKVENIKQEIF